MSRCEHSIPCFSCLLGVQNLVSLFIIQVKDVYTRDMKRWVIASKNTKSGLQVWDLEPSNPGEFEYHNAIIMEWKDDTWVNTSGNQRNLRILQDLCPVELRYAVNL